ncbi:extensin family protein [Phenylobacterium sp.]|uniref:extensin-like domain-containing protein n=1 Tax=Phenylobacterium sp. TaxID=1871053 RepID=UPI002733D471|nr:extensin family protein [Phenylobacterium sp.]MDP3659794.1 extensin family protein [Phenylobacterium sp.]
MPLKPASPFARFLAGVWSTALDLAVVGMALAFAVDAWAPPQDLPWKPLRLADPPGLATTMKFTRAADDPAACRAVMREGGVIFSEEPERSEGFCSTHDAVRLLSGAIALSPAAPVMTCRQALAYVFWSRHSVQPAARSLLGEPVARIEHYGTYACRNVYGRSQGRPSEHATANALDVAAFRTASGRRLTVSGDFRDEAKNGAFLRAARDGACRWFRAVLSPDYNAAHRDHLHLDFGRYRRCS